MDVSLHQELARAPHDRFASGRLVRWAVGLSAACAVAIATSIAVIAIAYGVGAESAIEDNWLAVLAAVVLGVGLLCSLLAWALAVVAWVRHERRALLWLPLCVFPAVILFLALGEAFWWE